MNWEVHELHSLDPLYESLIQGKTNLFNILFIAMKQLSTRLQHIASLHSQKLAVSTLPESCISVFVLVL